MKNFPLPCILLLCYIHVSYTHLDVYKRQVKVTADEQKRKEIYDQIPVIAAEELPMIPILYDVNVNVHNKAITGYKTVPGVEWATIQWAE